MEHAKKTNNNTKKRLAVIFGGSSTEHEVSLHSASAVLENIDRSKYDVIPVGITRNGEWYHYTGEAAKIADGTWLEDSGHLRPAAVSQSRAAKGLLELDGGNSPVFADKHLQRLF